MQYITENNDVVELSPGPILVLNNEPESVKDESSKSDQPDAAYGKKIADAFRDIKKLKNQVDSLNKSFKAIDDMHYKQMELRHKHLANAFQQLLDKVNLVSEVGFYLRHTEQFSQETRDKLFDALFMVFDIYDEADIKKMNDMSLKQLTDYLLDNLDKLQHKSTELWVANGR